MAAQRLKIQKAAQKESRLGGDEWQRLSTLTRLPQLFARPLNLNAETNPSRLCSLLPRKENSQNSEIFFKDYNFPNSSKKWDCKTCVEDLKKVSAVMDTKEAGEALAKLLAGEAFCKAEDLALDDEQYKVCVGYVEKGAVMGFQYIFKLVGEHSKDVCTKLYEVCKPFSLF